MANPLKFLIKYNSDLNHCYRTNDFLNFLITNQFRRFSCLTISILLAKIKFLLKKVEA